MERNSERVIQKLGASFPIFLVKQVAQESDRGCTTFQIAKPQLRRGEEVEIIEAEIDSGCSSSDAEDPSASLIVQLHLYHVLT